MISSDLLDWPSQFSYSRCSAYREICPFCSGQEAVKAVIQFSGSFAKTYKGHGTDKAVIAGILGMDTDDARIRSSMQIATEEGLDFTFIEEDIDGAHPNTAEITLTDEAGRTALIRGASIGGGNIIINKINDTEVSISGKSDTLVIPHDDVPGMIAVVTNILQTRVLTYMGSLWAETIRAVQLL